MIIAEATKMEDEIVADEPYRHNVRMLSKKPADFHNMIRYFSVLLLTRFATRTFDSI